jgi:uncharacterized protein YndB with AHSA1/START domain
MNETAEEKPILKLNRVIPASRERVFTAWTTPEAVKAWFGPGDCQVLEALIDLRVGGEFCFSLLTPGLGEIRVRGEYREVTPPKKLTYTWRWEGHSELTAGTSLVSVQFLSVGAATEIQLTHQQFTTIESRERHGQGWKGALDNLERYLVA